jgi:hypothetical protein
MVNLKTTDNTAGLKDRLDKLKRTRVLVGVPESEAARQGEINNAQLAYLHTNGSELQHIPPRPIIEPVITKNKDKISEMLKAAGAKQLRGEDASVEYERIGMFAKNKIVANFTDPDNGWPENSPLTVAKKGSDKPLIDTGALRQSIGYVIQND